MGDCGLQTSRLEFWWILLEIYQGRYSPNNEPMKVEIDRVQIFANNLSDEQLKRISEQYPNLLKKISLDQFQREYDWLLMNKNNQRKERWFKITSTIIE